MLDFIGDDWQVVLLQGANPLRHRFPVYACEEDQFSKAGVERTLRRDLRAGGRVHHGNLIGRAAGIGEGFVGFVQAGVDHPVEDRLRSLIRKRRSALAEQNQRREKKSSAKQKDRLHRVAPSKKNYPRDGVYLT